MSVKLDQDGSVKLSGENNDPYGLPIQEDIMPRKEAAKSTLPLNRSRTIIGGIRVPNLRDLDSRYVGKTKPNACRFDIVEKVETIIKPGSYGPPDHRPGVTAVKFDSSKDLGYQKLAVSRQPTFHAGPLRSSEDSYMLDRLGPYHWNKWVKGGRERDARDVLYRNTYCMDKEELRYRSLMLPRISQDKAWTVDMHDGNKSVTEKLEGEYDHVIIPKQPRGTVVRFREYMRPATYGGESHSLEIRRLKSQTNQMNHFTAIRNVFPQIRQDSRQSSRRSGGSERPLKFENSRYTTKNTKSTLFNKHIYPAYKNAFDRDYSSADTFREYLESLQNNGVMKHNFDVMSRENTRYEIPNSLDYQNHVLQSVQDVNKPFIEGAKPETANPNDNTSQPRDTRSQITVEIKPSWTLENDDQNTPRDVVDGPEVLDNISSVHGSGTNKAGDVPLPKTSSIIGTKKEGSRSVVGTKRDDDNGSLCPANTPTPDDDI